MFYCRILFYHKKELIVARNPVTNLIMNYPCSFGPTTLTEKIRCGVKRSPLIPPHLPSPPLNHPSYVKTAKHRVGVNYINFSKIIHQVTKMLLTALQIIAAYLRFHLGMLSCKEKCLHILKKLVGGER